MSNAKKCDRCGVLYEISDNDDVPSCCGRKIRKLAICSGNFEMEFDLCPSCAKAALSFLFYKKEDKKDDTGQNVTGNDESQDSSREDSKES